MPKNRKAKMEARARQARTGEKYVTARRNTRLPLGGEAQAEEPAAWVPLPTAVVVGHHWIERRDELAQKYPALTIRGFCTRYLFDLDRDDPRYITDRAALLAPEAVLQVLTAHDFVKVLGMAENVNRALGPSSELRHLAGEWGKAAGLSPFVENGPMVAGIIATGFGWDFAGRRSRFPEDVYVAATRTRRRWAERWIAAAEVHGPVRTHHALEDAKLAAYGAGSGVEDLSVRVASYEAVCRAHFERSLGAHIRRGAWERHPTFEVYAAAYSSSVGDHRSDIIEVFRAKYGNKPSKHLPHGRSHWE